MSPHRWTWSLSMVGVVIAQAVAVSCTPFNVLNPDAGKETQASSGSAGASGDDPARMPPDGAAGSEFGTDVSTSADAMSKTDSNPEMASDRTEAQDQDGGQEGSACDAKAVAPRLISPLSTTFVTSSRPTLRWEGGVGCGSILIDLCRDPMCAQILSTMMPKQGATAARPDVDLPVGVTFWRARSGSYIGTTWSFFVGKSTNVDSSWGTFSDYNGDGKTDVAVGTSDDSVYIYYGDVGGFGASPTHVSVADGKGLPHVDVLANIGDVSGDGIADLAIGTSQRANDPFTRVRIFLGSRSGISGPARQTLEFQAAPTDDSPRMTSAGDINGDGYGDFLLLRSHALLPFFGGATLLQGKEVVLALGAERQSEAFTTCDLNGDGSPDLVTLISSTGIGTFPVVVRGTGSGFVRQKDLSPYRLQDFVNVACADLTGDGYPDVMAASPYSDVRGPAFGDVVVFQNSAGVVSESSQSIDGQKALQSVYSGLALGVVGDMNGDGNNDVVIGNTPELGELIVAFNPISGTAADIVELGGTPDVEGHFGQAFVGGDFDGDGLADLVVSSPVFGTGGRLTLFRGSRTARVLSPSTIHVDAPPGVTGFGTLLSN